MECPKCGHEQPNAPECAACGIIIEKFLKAQAAKEAGAEAASAATSRRVAPLEESSPWPKRLAGLAILAGVIGGAYALMGEEPEPTRVAAVAVPAAAPGAAPAPPSASRNAVESARDATVTVRTPWGVGSGFFVNERCEVVTNRHVVSLSDDQRDQVGDKLTDYEDQLEAVRKQLEARKAEFLARCSDCSEEAYRKHVGQYEARYQEARDAVADGRNTLHSMVAGHDLVIVTVDGAEHAARIEQVSDELDLALLSSVAQDCYWLDVGDEDALEHGDKLFAIGSPMGLGHTVTSGVFSGFREFEDGRLLQTDAPINPGNSGGPLVNARGEVVGVNTLTALNADGIGFAIPFGMTETVLGLR